TKPATNIARRDTRNHLSLFHASSFYESLFLTDCTGTRFLCKFILKFPPPRRNQRSGRNRVALSPPVHRPPSAGSYRLPQFWASTYATKSSRDHLRFAKNGPLGRSPLPG